MTIRLNPRWLLVSVLLFSLQFCRAQSSLSFNLGSGEPNDPQLWDLTGNYDVNLQVFAHNGNSIPVQISFFLIQDASGKLSGSAGNFTGLVFNNDENSSFAITTKITGKVTGSGGFARAHFIVHFSGNGSFGGIPDLPVDGSLTVDADVDASSGQLSAPRFSNFKANIGNGLNTIQGKSDFAVGLPVNGTWNLSLEVAGLNQFDGTAIVGVSGQTLGFRLNGNFKNGLIKLNAKGAADVPNASSGVGLHARILLTPSFDTLQLDGKLLGQKISLNVATSSE